MDKPNAMSLAARHQFLNRARAGGIELVEDAFERYCRLHGIDRAQLAALLACDGAGLDRMCLCTLPRTAKFDQDAAAIANLGGANVSALATLLRASVAANQHSLVAEPPAPYSTAPEPPREDA
jgi:hypothetical protein